MKNLIPKSTDYLFSFFALGTFFMTYITTHGFIGAALISTFIWGIVFVILFASTQTGGIDTILRATIPIGIGTAIAYFLIKISTSSGTVLLALFWSLVTGASVGIGSIAAGIIVFFAMVFCFVIMVAPFNSWELLKARKKLN